MSPPEEFHFHDAIDCREDAPHICDGLHRIRIPMRFHKRHQIVAIAAAERATVRQLHDEARQDERICVADAFLPSCHHICG